MEKKSTILYILIAFSLVNTVYSILLILILHHMHSVAGGSTSRVILNYSYDLIPISFASLGWLATIYEVFSTKQKSILKELRKELPKSKDKWTAYEILKGRGAPRRFVIMESLDGPKHKSEIAKQTGIDWKEVDRNIKKLESGNLVRVQTVHGSVVLYELTEKGKIVLQKAKSIADSTS